MSRSASQWKPNNISTVFVTFSTEVSILTISNWAYILSPPFYFILFLKDKNMIIIWKRAIYICKILWASIGVIFLQCLRRNPQYILEVFLGWLRTEKSLQSWSPLGHWWTPLERNRSGWRSNCKIGPCHVPFFASHSYGYRPLFSGSSYRIYGIHCKECNRTPKAPYAPK